MGGVAIGSLGVAVCIGGVAVFFSDAEFLPVVRWWSPGGLSAATPVSVQRLVDRGSSREAAVAVFSPPRLVFGVRAPCL